jgi:hypothetical protein
MTDFLIKTLLLALLVFSAYIVLTIATDARRRQQEQRERNKKPW